VFFLVSQVVSISSTTRVEFLRGLRGASRAFFGGICNCTSHHKWNPHHKFNGLHVVMQAHNQGDAVQHRGEIPLRWNFGDNTLMHAEPSTTNSTIGTTDRHNQPVTTQMLSRDKNSCERTTVIHEAFSMLPKPAQQPSTQVIFTII